MKYLAVITMGCWLLGLATLAKVHVVSASVFQFIENLLKEQPAAQQAVPASLFQLIANPEQFDGKRVGVYGFLVLPEDPRPYNDEPILFVYREDAEHQLMQNSIWVEPNNEMKRNRAELTGMYVTMTGRFLKGHEGHYYFQYGGLTEITECNPYSSPNRPFLHKYDDLRPQWPKPR